jgi:hypothetical protein
MPVTTRSKSFGTSKTGEGRHKIARRWPSIRAGCTSQRLAGDAPALKESLRHLPSSVKKVALRSDTAGYE